MSPRGRNILWALIGAGVVARLAVAYSTYGQPYDMESLHLVRDALLDDPLHVYERVNLDVESGLVRWPYAPGYFAWLAVADVLPGVFHGTVQLLPIAADALIALVVADFLGRRGASERTRLAAAGLIALGPSFAVVSGYHGHFDSVAILPVVVALWAWEGGVRPERRALVAGALIGVGAAVKTVPALMLAALLPKARGLREAGWLAVPAVAIPALALAPFFRTDPGAVRDALGYHGAPGVGGVSLLTQPNLAEGWIGGQAVAPNAATDFFLESGGLVSASVGAGLLAFLLWTRPPAVQGAVVVWLALYVFAPGFFLQYAVWGMPFFLMAGYLGRALALQVVLLPPTVMIYSDSVDGSAAVALYVACMLAVWLGFAIWLSLLAARCVRYHRRAHSSTHPEEWREMAL
ncbi:MAG: hypothetical protein H0V29_11770 [Thermoleophilaceae bacterium]|nr:hypothetical protein [Thermoleophilaceae bacterium]